MKLLKKITPVALILLLFTSCNITKVLKLKKIIQAGAVTRFEGKKTFHFNSTENHKYIVLKTNIDTLSMNLIMDYGAPCLISDHLKNKISEPLKELKTKGDLPNGEKKELTLYYFISQKFKINDIAFSELGFIVSDMSDIITALNADVDGLLGINALNELITEINFETQTVNVYTDALLLKTEGFHKIPYIYQSKVQKTPMIPCTINGVKVQLILDTGYGGMLTLSSTEIYNGIPDSLIKKETVTGITAGAKYQIEKNTTTINAIDFDNFKINRNIAINIVKSEEKGENTGVIGIEFLREFFSEVIINPFNKEIYFKLK